MSHPPSPSWEPSEVQVASPQAQHTDQDSPWKEIIEQYFPEFLQFFFPNVHAAIDWHQPHAFLDKELQKIVPAAERSKRFADKLVKVWLHDGSETWILIHIEVQGRKDPHFLERMYVYNYRISDRYNRPVLSLAILGNTNPQWRPQVHRQEILNCRLEFHFPIVKPLDYRDRTDELEASPNPFVIVVLAHLQSLTSKRDLQQRKTGKIHLIRRLYEKGYPRQDVINLFRFIDWILQLPQALAAEVWEIITAYEQEGNMPYITSIERLGIEKGRQEGRQEEGRSLILRLLTRRIGNLPPALAAQVQTLSLPQLEALAEALLDFTELADLMN
ncbi:DUF4351 domain-containing protein [Trichothermofontia sichuanensis B231]|uniref:DUF4351 domain-containing protein n=1 Tax=Trichothermofontia sichuanensis TaxID=3045816 RepID=UPI0022478917|nr:DUF4351 domain-containing protein [Trichothermofontia sichuanensis]UZQ54495.1 DUF4351 domain-containing protein [Trichothermofontia sichuanensis B231]